MDGTLLCERCGNAYDKPLVIRTYDDESEQLRQLRVLGERRIWPGCPGVQARRGTQAYAFRRPTTSGALPNALDVDPSATV